MVDKIQLTRTENKPVEIPDGAVSLVKTNDFLPAYIETARKFLKDNENLGDGWVKDTSGKLLIYQNKGGFVAQSNSYAGVLAASLIPMVTYTQMRRACDKAGTTTPFGEVYIDLGFNINGTPQTNETQAKYLLEQMKTRGIKAKDPRGFSFNQLELKASPEAGLVFGIREGVSDGEVDNLDSSKFATFGKNGLFRAFLGRNGNWYANSDNLAGSNVSGRVVRYDAEGVSPKKLDAPKPRISLADTLINDYRTKLKI